jgi:hypothetical protein
MDRAAGRIRPFRGIYAARPSPVQPTWVQTHQISLMYCVERFIVMTLAVDTRARLLLTRVADPIGEHDHDGIIETTARLRPLSVGPEQTWDTRSPHRRRTLCTTRLAHRLVWRAVDRHCERDAA